MLLLGGSTLDILLQEPSEEPAQAAEMPMEASNSLAIRGPFGCRDLRGFRQRCAAALVDAVQALSKLVTLEVTFFNQQIVAKVAEELPAIQVCLSSPASRIYRQVLRLDKVTALSPSQIRCDRFLRCFRSDAGQSR